jgi:hypothetical protein
MSIPVPSGPQELNETELRKFGLGFVVRLLRSSGATPATVLRRVYCRLCGIAIDHEAPAAEWWLCRNDCNAPVTA